MVAISSQGKENDDGFAAMSGARIISGIAMSTISSCAFAQPNAIKMIASCCTGIGLLFMLGIVLCVLVMMPWEDEAKQKSSQVMSRIATHDFSDLLSQDRSTSVRSSES